MAEFDTYQKNYEESIDSKINYIGKPQQFFTICKAEYLSELFNRWFPPEQKIAALDVGCGNGSIHPFLLERCPRVQLHGVDVASVSIDDARRENPQVVYETYDGSTLPYNAGRFDVAFAICVMHHVPQSAWSSFLDEMRRVVRPKGLVCIIEHNPFNPLTQLLVNTCEFDKNAKLLRAGRLSGLMRRAGFADVKSRFIQFTPFEGGFFKRFDRNMGWLPLGAQYLVTAQVPSR
jgi:SAM-dependent methyltransferase